MLLEFISFGKTFSANCRTFSKDNLEFEKLVAIETKMSISDIFLNPWIISYQVI